MRVYQVNKHTQTNTHTQTQTHTHTHTQTCKHIPKQEKTEFSVC